MTLYPGYPNLFKSRLDLILSTVIPWACAIRVSCCSQWQLVVCKILGYINVVIPLKYPIPKWYLNGPCNAVLIVYNECMDLAVRRSSGRNKMLLLFLLQMSYPNFMSFVIIV